MSYCPKCIAQKCEDIVHSIAMIKQWVSDKGFYQLALRSGNYLKIVVTDVRKGEIENFDPFLNEYKFKSLSLEERMAKGSKGELVHPIIGYYAMFILTTGFKQEMFMSKDEMDTHAKKYSKAYRNDLDKGYSASLWTTDYESMAKKTMLRQLLSKYGIMTPDLERAYVSDMSVLDENLNPEYVDNTEDDPREVADPSEKHLKTKKKTEVVADVDYTEINEMPMPDAFK